MKLINATRQTVLAENVEFADTAKKRLIGLLGQSALAANCALYLEPCQQVHTCFMRFTMDALFVSSDGKVLKVICGMKPWRLSPWVFGARGVYEFADGVLSGRVVQGDSVQLAEK